MTSKEFEALLQELDYEAAKLMLKDLKNDEKRNPQLFNAVVRMLERHKHTIAKVVPDENILISLASELPDLTEDEQYGGILQ